MQLRNQVEWALHCCSILAGLPAGCYLSTKALAELHGVPKEYLSKALQGLSQAGLVESTLGPSGGYRLAKAPAQIAFLDIVEAVEGKASSFVCDNIRYNNPCLRKGYRSDGACAIAQVMWDADQAWRDKLRAVTLADLAKNLRKTVPAEILDKTQDWVLERS
ncbi:MULTISPECIES: Rrf2 family transcriptional regulator [unclassified Beijerinckia]|uniref:RrF2 family transcriptional regulator n=1 Tax=unclassified Beijerinckia TaxID=2638183 RepID=UPI00089D3D2D|nr:MULTISPECIES: Rrf2 family transcriptional regulator [unclassified Beijerinckia]MDH7799321.1 Rrf2 family protein [Beijerinckia sp. GAS462]SED46165.1 transcriptional regulator, BadM/Rrf2 family [Beijerinckia sp. 28-YEA-48]